MVSFWLAPELGSFYQSCSLKQLLFKSVEREPYVVRFAKRSLTGTQTDGSLPKPGPIPPETRELLGINTNQPTT